MDQNIFLQNYIVNNQFLIQKLEEISNPIKSSIIEILEKIGLTKISDYSKKSSIVLNNLIFTSLLSIIIELFKVKLYKFF